MLRELRLHNLAIATDVRVELSPGLNVLSGSTGAGKSLLVEAVRWLTGAPVDRERIRAGAPEAAAEALFDLGEREDLVAALEELGIEAPLDGCLRLRREVRAQGRTRAFLDARPTSAAVLAAVTSRLVELQSQHQQTELLQRDRHRSLLDACGVAADLRRRYRDDLLDYRERADAVERWRRRREELLSQHDLLSHQRNELVAAGLVAGETDRLRERVALLADGADLLEAAGRARQALEAEEGGVLSGLRQAMAPLARIPEAVADAVAIRADLRAALELVEEAARGLGRFLDAADLDPRALDAAQERLARLEELQRKYGRTEDELIALRDRLDAELADLDLGRDVPATLAEPLEAARQRLETAAAALLRARRATARRVAKAADPLLADLGMPGAALRFAIDLVAAADGPLRIAGTPVPPRDGGVADVRLEVRTNPGEPLAPVEKIASGGELSRIGLVLRTLSARTYRPALVILDEVDAGLGADLGPALARRLRAMADGVQVLAISHLPAVAAAAHRHLQVSKARQGGRTHSRVRPLAGKERIDEVARMLGGLHEESRRMARRLLAESPDVSSALEVGG